MSMRFPTTKQKYKSTSQKQNSNQSFRGRARNGLRLTGKSFVGATLLLGMAFAIVGKESAMAAACTAATADLGTLSMQVAIPTDGDYTIWTRMQVTDATKNSVNLEVDGATCYSVGGGAFAATTWTNDSANWVNYANGTAATTVHQTLTAGNHTLKFIGTQEGLSIDKVIVTSDSVTKPTGDGANMNQQTGTTPVINIVKPTNNSTATGSVEIAATSDKPLAKMEFSVDGAIVGTDDSEPYSFNWNSASVQNGAHLIVATGTDAQGVAGISDNVTVTTNNAVTCSGNPAAPTNVKISGTTASSISLSWTASVPADSCNIKEYKIYRDGTAVASAPGTTFSDTGLTPGSTHKYTIQAVDSSNHQSEQSAEVSGSAQADTAAPSKPANLRLSLATSTSVGLAWDASTDNNAVTSYEIYRNGQKVGTSQTAGYSDTGLSPKTSYSYTVKAFDAAGNPSEASDAFTASTIDGPAGGGGGGTIGEPNSIYLTPPNGTYAPGSTIAVTIHVHSGTSAVTSAEAILNYSSNLEFQSVDVTGSAYSFGCPSKSGGSGVVDVACIVPLTNDAITKLTGDQVLGVVNFKVLAEGTGTITIGDASAAMDDTGSDVISSRNGASFTLATATTPPTPTPTTPPSPTPTPNPTPTPTPTPSTTRPTPSPTPSTVRPSTTPSTTTGTTTKPTTTVTPTGTTTPVVVPDESTVELSDPAVVQTSDSDSSTSDIVKVEYYLNNKKIATVTEPPFSYSVNTKQLRNGKYTLTTVTYYKDGQSEKSNVALVVKNPMDATQIMLQLKHYAWLLILLFLIIAAAIWFLFFKNRSGGDDYSDDGFGMISPTDGSGTPYDTTGGAGGMTPPSNYGNPYAPQ